MTYVTRDGQQITVVVSPVILTVQHVVYQMTPPRVTLARSLLKPCLMAVVVIVFADLATPTNGRTNVILSAHRH